MTNGILYTPLQASEIDELATVLQEDAVYEFIGGMPAQDDVVLGLQNAIQGPPADTDGEYWINYVGRLVQTGEMIGRLEATVHDGLAEVAFLYKSSFWGRGYASEGLLWLHEQLRRYIDVSSLWATTHPANLRCAALLKRCGYLPVPTQGLPKLYSYDEGDFVFRRSVC